MNFTFGIVTQGDNDKILEKLVDSIHSQNIPHYEIIIVGHTNIVNEKIYKISFDENAKKGWITRKKNIICETAKYENIVLLHDYLILCDKWYEGFLLFGSNFDICVTKIITKNGKRFRDYTLFPYDLGYPYNQRALIPYDYKIDLPLSKLMYVSGAYYIIKKSIALKYPLNENLSWGEGEDAELSKRLINDNIIIKCNTHSTVQLQKEKDQQVWENTLTSNDIQYLETLSHQQINAMNNISCNNIRNYIRDHTGLVLKTF
jgi:hypothetical protein